MVLVNLGLGYAVLASFLVVGMTLLCFLCLNGGENIPRVLINSNNILMQLFKLRRTGNLGRSRIKAFKSFKDMEKANMQECVICMEEFKGNDQIAELKCDERHYFHAACLEDWLKRKLECPLCKRVVGADE